MKKEFDKIVRIRRSVRRYKKTEINDDDVKDSILHASLAPNSSNLQLWEFYHVTSEKLMNRISEACFNQPAARTANQFVVIVTRKDLWNKRRIFNINTIKNKTLNASDKSLKNRDLALKYYKYLIPTIYKEFFGLLGYIRYINAMIIGLFRPIYRQVTNSDMRVVAHKSSALAAQNFMLSMTSKGYDTCPMEGFDSLRVKRILSLPYSSEINMVISCGIRDDDGVYGKQIRVPFDDIYFKR
jgi:nitroreductase|tara:strand:+ start:136 stop:858 length:723 start_codon:yes stop_codon:yes gene_type:complete